MSEEKNARIARRRQSRDLPFYPVLNTQMKAELIVNDESDVWLLHDQPLREIVKWAEYDVEDNKMILVMISGKFQEIGIVIPEEMREILPDATQIFLMHVDNGDIVDFGMVRLMIRGNIVH